MCDPHPVRRCRLEQHDDEHRSGEPSKILRATPANTAALRTNATAKALAPKSGMCPASSPAARSELRTIDRDVADPKSALRRLTLMRHTEAFISTTATAA